MKISHAQNEHLIEVREGTHGIAAAVERPNSRRLKLNNYYVLGGTSSVGDERMQAHIPLLIHPSPQRVGFLGLGTGITGGGAVFHPVTKITIVEMVPEVVHIARLHFRQANAAVLDDPRTRIVVEDARNYLRGTSEKFDVLINDLVVPWREGEGALFTVEHFRAAKEKLAPGGIFCVWLPCFQLSLTEVTILARTFLTVFPEALVWRGDFSPRTPAVAFIAGAPPYKLDANAITRRLAQLRRDDSNPQLQDTIALWMQFVGTLHPEDLPSDAIVTNSEDWPVVEFLGPMQHGSNRDGAQLIGRRLQEWQNQIQQRGTNSALSASEPNIGREAGTLLFEYTLLLSERREAEARTVESRLKNMLPVSLVRVLFP